MYNWQCMCVMHVYVMLKQIVTSVNIACHILPSTSS